MTSALEGTADLAKSVATIIASAQAVRNALRRRQHAGCRCQVCREEIAELQDAVALIADAIDAVGDSLGGITDVVDTISRIAMRADRVSTQLAVEMLPALDSDAAARVRAQHDDSALVEQAQHSVDKYGDS